MSDLFNIKHDSHLTVSWKKIWRTMNTYCNVYKQKMWDFALKKTEQLVSATHILVLFVDMSKVSDTVGILLFVIWYFTCNCIKTTQEAWIFQWCTCLYGYGICFISVELLVQIFLFVYFHILWKQMWIVEYVELRNKENKLLTYIFKSRNSFIFSEIINLNLFICYDWTTFLSDAKYII